jgi:hypothetical protein
MSELELREERLHGVHSSDERKAEHAAVSSEHLRFGNVVVWVGRQPWITHRLNLHNQTHRTRNA